MGRVWAHSIAVAAGVAVWFLIPYGTYECLSINPGSLTGCFIDKHELHTGMAVLATWVVALNLLWPRS